MSSMGDTNNPSTASPFTANTGFTATSKTNVSPPRKKPYKEKSSVWNHFTKLKNDQGKVINAECNYCKIKYLYSSANGTGSLLKHTPKCSKYPYNDKVKGQQLLLFQSTGQEGDSSLAPWKFDQELCRDALTRMLIVDELPFKFVEREGFRQFVSVLQPKFRLLSRTTVAKDCYQLYANERLNLKKVLNTSVQRVSITTDLWTSLQNISYMCLTAHFIDKDWKLQKKIINFCVVTSHKGEAIGKAVEACLLQWDIGNICTITVDNASSNDVAIAYLKKKLVKKHGCLLGGEFLHVRCCAHILNLIVKEGLSDVHDSVTKIRGAVKYIRSSPARAVQFKKCVEAKKITCKSSLVLDVPTRWNSTYLMLDTALKFQKAFERLEEHEPQFQSELKDGVPTEEDWNNARVLSKFLQTFFKASQRLSGSLYVTSNAYFHEVCIIEAMILDWSRSLDPSLSSMAKKMKERFDKYWGNNFDKVNMLLLVAVVLDPVYKLRYLKFTYSKVYSPEKVEALTTKIRETLMRIYQHYELLDSSSTVLPNTSQNFNDMDVEQPTYEYEKIAEQRYLEFCSQVEEEESVGSKSEVDRYLEESVCKKDPNFQILDWWRSNSSKYRILSKVARDVLCIPVSTVASESAFSTGGRVLDQFRSSLTPKLVECLICAQDWLRASQLPIDVEETLDELEDIESVITTDFPSVS